VQKAISNVRSRRGAIGYQQLSLAERCKRLSATFARREVQEAISNVRSQRGAKGYQQHSLGERYFACIGLEVGVEARDIVAVADTQNVQIWLPEMEIWSKIVSICSKVLT
jgi:hypothetical protein